MQNKQGEWGIDAVTFGGISYTSVTVATMLVPLATINGEQWLCGSLRKAGHIQEELC